MSTPQRDTRKSAEHYQVFKLRLRPTDAQRSRFEEEARAARWAYNSYLRHWYTTRESWFKRRDELIANGMDKVDANSQASREAQDNSSLKALSWTAFARQFVTPTCRRHRQAAELFAALENPDLPAVDLLRITAEIEECWGKMGSVQPWAHLVHRRSLTTGLQYADRAIQNYLASLSPSYTGPRVGKPRFKKRNSPKSISMDAETIGAYGAYDFRKQGRIENYHRVRLGPFRSVRTYDSTKPLSKAIKDGGKAKNFTLTERAGCWYVAIRLELDTPRGRPVTRAQRENGVVGLDFGVKEWLVASNGQVFSLPIQIKEDEVRIRKLQKKLARAQKGSNRRAKLAARISKLHHLLALRRSTFIHEVTKVLATQFSAVAIEDLNVAGMTASARGSVEKPGKNVRQKAGLNRGILAGAPAELRRQLEYKAHLYGSETVVIDRFYASSKTCSQCGEVKRDLTLADRIYRCEACGLEIDRDHNAAINICTMARQGL